MPPVRHSPSQRVRDRVNPIGATLQPTAETSSSSSAPRNTSQKQHLSPVWNGHQVTPAAYFLLSNGVDHPLLHGFSPIHIHNSSRIFDPSLNLPLPPKPLASLVQDSPRAQLTRQAASVLSDSSASSSASSSTTPPPALSPPTFKSNAHPSTSLPPTTDTSFTACICQPSAQSARPSNNFVLFRVDYFARVHSLLLSTPQYNSLPKVYDEWEQAPDTVRTYYRELAHLTKEVHGRLHPGYKYQPRKKDEKQRQKDENARLKREAMAKARASRTTKTRTKSSKTPTARTTPSPALTTSVDVRIYNPARRTYYRLHTFEACSIPLPPPFKAPPNAPSPASSPSPARSGVQNAARMQGADHLPSSSSSPVTSPAYTLFQREQTESPRIGSTYCHTYANADNSEFNAMAALWPTIEDDVDWYQAAPPHWCGPDDHPFWDDDACDNCMSLSWSEELTIDIPTALAASTRYGFAGPGYSFALDPTLHTPSKVGLSVKFLNFAREALDALLAPTIEAHVNGGLDGMVLSAHIIDTLHNQPPPPLINHSAPPNGYTGFA